MRKNLKEKNADKVLIKQQAERLEDLRKENVELQKLLNEYRLREKEITDALNFAKTQGEKYLSNIKLKCAIECDRINSYRERLKKFRSKEELIRAYDNAFKELGQWQTELEEGFDLPGPMRDYLNERSRLNDDPQLNYGSIINDKADLFTAEKISDEDLSDLLDQL